MSNQTSQPMATDVFILPEELLEHWQGHRALTRRVIEAFPEDAFFTYSLGGMRPFAEMVKELLAIAGPGMKEIVTGKTSELNEGVDLGESKSNALKLWDAATDVINDSWAKVSPERFHDNFLAFGQYEGPVYSTILYFIENEIHHRGQAYVYLRSLGIEPPFFWDR